MFAKIYFNHFQIFKLKIVFETFETYLYGLPNAIKLLQDLLMYHEEFYLFLNALNESCKIVLFDFIFLPFKFIKLICSFCNEKSDLKEIDGLYKLNKSMCCCCCEFFY